MSDKGEPYEGQMVRLDHTDFFAFAGVFVACNETVQGPESAQFSHFKKPAVEIFSMDETGEYPLIAAKNIKVGTIKVSNDDENLYVEVQTDDEWFISETYLHVGLSLDDFPLAGKWGNPIPGKFDYKKKQDPHTTTYEYNLLLGNWEPGDVLMIAVHAAVSHFNGFKLVGEESAWGAGERFTNKGNWAMYCTYTVEEYGLLLENSLSSVDAIENSMVGPSGTIVGNVNFDHDVIDGKGITPNTGYAGSGIDFPTTIVDPEKGTVEMWVQFYDIPRPYSHGVYGFVNVNHWKLPSFPYEISYHNVMLFSWYNPSQLNFSLKFNGSESGISFTNFSPKMNTPVHLACVWDREGIDGSGDYMRIYVDVAVVASNDSNNSWGNDNTAGAFRVATTWDRNFDTDRYSVASLKIWDHAKTEF